MGLRALIADDEALARERLKLLLTADNAIEVIGECRNGNELSTALKASHADLLFLDIQMPGKDVFEVIEEIGLPKMPMTIFVTAHNKYAVEAFEIHALDYLVKPIERKRLADALEQAKERIRHEEVFTARHEISSMLEALRTVSQENHYPQRFLAKNGNTSAVVSVEEIEWIEAADYYSCLHAGGKKHLVRQSIKAFETKLDPNKFVRLHRSAIVNINHIREIHRDGRSEGWIVLSTGERVRMNNAGWHKLVSMNGISQDRH